MKIKRRLSLIILGDHHKHGNKHKEVCFASDFFLIKFSQRCQFCQYFEKYSYFFF